jgi:hypothetical protein
MRGRFAPILPDSGQDRLLSPPSPPRMRRRLAGTGDLEALIDHLTRSGLRRGEATRVVAEVLEHFSETTEEFVRRRHRELQRRGLANSESFAAIAEELAARRVAAPALSERQIRRIVYG